MPWDNRNGWLGVKHQITYILTRQEDTGLFVLHKGIHSFVPPRHDIGIVTAQAQAVVPWNVAAS